MLKAYKYRIYPTDAQKLKIQQTIGVCRLVYNLALQTKIEAYMANGTRLSAFDLCYQLADMKKDYDWMRDVDSQALQAAVKKVDGAFKGFFDGKGFPKYKSKKGKQSFQSPHPCKTIDFEKGLLTILKMKNIPIRISRGFTGKMKTITISKSPSGKYFASILVDNGATIPKTKPIKEAIGIDLGIKHFAVMSDGSKTDNPKHYKSNIQRLKCLQRRVSRKVKGSNNKKKATKTLSLHHEKITNRRQDFLHKLSSAITKQYDTVCLEDLNVAGMVKNRKLSQAISDVGWSEFVRQLEYKSKWEGNNFIQIGRFEPSSKMCHHCGDINNLLTLKDREWTCATCGTIHDRDISAAINIKKLGLKKHSGEGISGEPVELSALAGAKKQELDANSKDMELLIISKTPKQYR